MVNFFFFFRVDRSKSIWIAILGRLMMAGIRFLKPSVLSPPLVPGWRGVQGEEG
jgi:hypothetical protein